MTDGGLRVTLELPCELARLEASGAALDALLEQSLLVLRVVNQIEGHAGREGESEPHVGRLEAKLDLALHLLARSLDGERAAKGRTITLHANGFDLPEGRDLRVGDRLLLSIQLSPALPLPMRLPATIIESGAGTLRAEWTALPEAFAESWAQWLFRRHRRQVHELRDGKTPGSSA